MAAAAAEFLTAEFRQDRLISGGTELPVLSCTVSLALFGGGRGGGGTGAHAGRAAAEQIDREDSARDELISAGSGLGEMRGSGEGRVLHGMSSGQLFPVIA